MRHFFLMLMLIFFSEKLFAEPIQIVAAENIYGDIAQTIGGNVVKVHNILNSPNDDPHLFNIDPQSAAILSNAQIIIINGAGYDSWVDPLIKNGSTKILNVSQINHVPDGSNPHLWYNLNDVQNFANALTQRLNKLEPNNPQFNYNLKTFTQQLDQIQHQLNAAKQKFHGAPVTATEPVAGYLLQALALKVLDTHLQLSIMNDTEPSAQDFAHILQNLRTHRVKALIYNLQVNNPTTQKIQQVAIQSGIPIIGMTELLPTHEHYFDWYRHNLEKLITTLNS